MEKYYCECCNYSTNHKTKFNRHLGTKKHEKSSQSHHKVTTKSPFLVPKVTTKSPQSHHKVTIFDPKTAHSEFVCKYCQKTFKFKQGMYRHIKLYCKKSEDEDLKELVRLMNEQLKEKDKELKEKDKKMQSVVKNQERNHKLIKKLADKLQITNYNHQHNVVVNNNIRLLNYKDTDLSHLTSTDYKAAINQVNYATFELIKKIHFNPNKPENMNIYIPNIKDKYVVMFKENAWQIQTRHKEVDDLMEDKYILLREWYNENVRYANEDEFTILKKNFERFDENIDDNGVRDVVKNEIIMFLYNKRNMVVKHQEETELLAPALDI
uniref:C2H2-type domain-containing protein n=1 Tax=viral metagenome TaxID=1070528 RepID=A0A6C0KJ31_9ZZZZ